MKLRKVEINVYGRWMIGYTYGNTDSQGRIGIKMFAPNGASDWFLPEYVRETEREV